MIPRVALAIVSFLSGMLVGTILVAFVQGWISTNVTLGQILQTIVVVMIFFLANLYFARIHERRKREADIRIEVVGDVAKAVQETHKAYIRCVPEQVISSDIRLQVEHCLRRYSNAVYTLERALHGVDSWTRPRFDELRKDRAAFKDLLTSDPYPSSVSDNLLSKESNLYGEIQANIRLFQLKLARS